MNSLPLSPLVISFILRDIYWENCCLQILRNTEALNSYQGLSALGKNYFGLYKIRSLSLEAINPGSMLRIIPNQSNLTS